MKIPSSRFPARWLALALLLVSTPSHGGGLNRAQAEALLHEGNALHERGDYAGALRKYREAQELYPSYRIGYNMALSLDALGQVTEVAELLERLLRVAPELLEPQELQARKRRLAELRQALGRIKIACSAQGAEVLLDGSPVAETPLDHVLFVRPGSHVVQLQGAEGQRMRQAVSVQAGEEVLVQAALASFETRARGARPKRLGAWISGAGAVATLASGVVLSVLARRQFGEFKTTQSGERYDELKLQIPRLELARDLSFGAAGALALTSAVLFYLDWRGGRQAERIVLAPQLGAGAGLAIGASF